MTLTEAKKLVGQMVQAVDSDIAGVLEYLTVDGWAGIRGPFRRLDEVQVARLEVDPT